MLRGRSRAVRRLEPEGPVPAGLGAVELVVAEEDVEPRGTGDRRSGRGPPSGNAPTHATALKTKGGSSGKSSRLTIRPTGQRSRRSSSTWSRSTVGPHGWHAPNVGWSRTGGGASVRPAISPTVGSKRTRGVGRRHPSVCHRWRRPRRTATSNPPVTSPVKRSASRCTPARSSHRSSLAPRVGAPSVKVWRPRVRFRNRSSTPSASGAGNVRASWSPRTRGMVPPEGPGVTPAAGAGGSGSTRRRTSPWCGAAGGSAPG